MRHENDKQVRGPAARRTEEQRRLAHARSANQSWRPQSESRTTCPHCKREPGGFHQLECPRYRLSARLWREIEAI